ncbi:MAG TPA: Lrp/AsnC family transcriptional regulator [Candidatus Thermoplasmatota archaeon]|nr:Lrp/AsnC family transcriptional regulator [Candidatus Thermoplasmatota archaeon]
MSKISKEQQDKDERKIFAELHKNSNESIDTIAKHCGFSRQKVWRLIKQLEKNKKIWGYSAIVGSEEQGLKKFILFFKRAHKEHAPKDTIEITTTHMNPMKKDLGITVISSYYIHGEYDWVTIFTAENLIQAKKFREALIMRFPDTQITQLSQILFTVRENCIENPNINEMKEFI